MTIARMDAVLQADLHKVTCSKLAIDTKVKMGEIPNAPRLILDVQATILAEGARERRRDDGGKCKDVAVRERCGFEKD